MKRSGLFFVVLLSGTLLSACTTADPSASVLEEKPLVESTSNSDDHHEGESNVAEHDDSMMKDHHEGETNVVPHDEGMMEDHHKGETNVAPHEDNEQKDHHEGESNVAEHDDTLVDHDDSDEPPHRH